MHNNTKTNTLFTKKYNNNKNMNIYAPYILKESSSSSSSSSSLSDRELANELFTEQTMNTDSTATQHELKKNVSWLGHAICSTAPPKMSSSPRKITKPTKLSSECFVPVTHSILKSTSAPLEVPEVHGEMITVQGETGVLANRQDLINWTGPLPLNKYPINEDPNPEVIRKQVEHPLQYVQEIGIRYLRPPTPPPPGDIVIQHEPDFVPPPAPPLVIRQQAPRPHTPPVLVLRENPPVTPPHVLEKVITISGKLVPPPPRKVIIERLPPMPPKPQQVVVERWLPYSPQKRRVVYIKPNEPDVSYEKVRNVIIQWDPPSVVVERAVKDLGVIRANPVDYMAKYGGQLMRLEEMPDFVRDIKMPRDLVVEPLTPENELEGDVNALCMPEIDLDKEGLSEYKFLLKQRKQVSIKRTLTPEKAKPTKEQRPTKVEKKESHIFLDVSSLLTQIIESIKSKSRERLTYNEAKSVIIQLNQKLDRMYDNDKVEKFLENIGLDAETEYEVESFKEQLLNSM